MADSRLLLCLKRPQGNCSWNIPGGIYELRLGPQGGRTHQKKAPQKLKATICCDNGFMGEAEISYAGPNALARAKLAGEVISERIQILGLQGQLRVEIIGGGSVHFSMDEASSYELPNDGDYRVRTSAIYPKRYQAQQMVDEVMSLYCCGPAAGGGGRGYVTPQSSTASILVSRETVSPNVQVKIL